jgi:hypothetical protein
MTSYSDSEQSKKNAEIAVKNERSVNKNDVINIKMVPGGGFAAWLEPVK